MRGSRRNRHLARSTDIEVVVDESPRRSCTRESSCQWVKARLVLILVAGCLVLLFLLIMFFISTIKNPNGVFHLSDVLLQDETLMAGAVPFVFYALVGCGIAYCVARVLKEYASVFVMLGRGIAKFGVMVEHPLYTVVKGAQKGVSVFHQVTQDRYNYTYKMTEGQDQQLALPSGEQAPTRVLTFAELLQNGSIQQAAQAGQLVLGYIDGVMTRGSWLELYSCAIAGKSGAGKSTTVLFLIYQAVLNGARLVVCDPHEGSSESLATRLEPIQAAFLTTRKFDGVPARETAEMMKRVRYLKIELEHRKMCKTPGETIIFIIDEFNAVMRKDEDLSREIADVLLDIAQEGRKYGLYALLIGQVWTRNSIRNADIRSSLASAIVHRTGKSQAELLLDDPEYARAATKLSEGVAYFMDTHGSIRELRTPWTTVQDGELVARLLSAGVHESSAKVVRNQGESSLLDGEIDSPESTTKPLRNQCESSLRNQSDEALQARVAQVLRLQAKGMTKTDIMKSVWDVSPGNNEKYRRANEEYTQLMYLIAEQLGVRCD